MHGGFTLVSEAELAAYHALLDWYGYPEDDFVLTERLDSPDTSETQVGKGFVSVTRKSTETTRYYRIPGQRPWTDDFDQDCQKGVFKAR
jgi:hypothetical protein